MPHRIERGKEIAGHGHTVAPQRSVAREYQGVAGKGKQDVVARLGRAVGDALKQVRVTRWGQAVQAGKVRKTADRSPGAIWCGRAGLRPGSLHTRRRITSVPLVPPKPKELDNATSIFIGRGVFGT